MNKLSKLTALLLALIMMFSAPLTAWAESIDTETKYEAQVSEILKKLYNTILQTTTYEEILAATETMTRTEIVNFLNRLLGETVVDDNFALYDSHILTLFDEYLESITFPKLVSYTRVAPFTAISSAFSLQNRASTTIDTSGTTAGMSATKSVNWDSANSKGTITIETFATGTKVVTTAKDKPTDIILVLDKSGSMSGRLYEYTPVSGNLNTWGQYYVEINGQYVRARYCNSCQKWMYGCEHLSYYGSSEEPIDLTNYTFYTRSQGDTKDEALEKAVNAFKAIVYEKAAGADKDISTTNGNVDHRLAVISYNTGATDYSNGFIAVDTAAGQSAFNTALANALSRDGSGTETNAGIAEALSILNNDSLKNDTGRKRVVIVFTDGTPSPAGGGGWSETNANAAIKNAKSIKDKDIDLFTIAIEDNANPSLSPDEWEDSEDINEFLHYVSSNYPNATSMDNPGDDGDHTRNFYLSAASTAALTSIFTQLAGNVSGGSSATLTEESVVRDVLTSTFQLPAGASSIRIYTADCTEVTTNSDGSKTYTFNDAARTQVYPATNATISPTINGQSISVSGFDFSEHWCGTETSDGSTSLHQGGQKLIIEIDIEPVDGYLGGNVIETNESTSGIYENEQAESPVVPLPDPKDVNVKPLTIKPKVITQDLNIYLTNNVNVVDVVLNLGYFWDDVDGDGNLDWTDTDQDLVFDPSEDTATDEIYTVDGIRNKDANLVYTIKDGDTTLATFTIPAGKTYADVESINWIKYGTTDEVTELTTLLEEDKTYTVTCEVIQTTTGTPENGGFGSTIDSDTATINVFKPVLTFQDSVEKYLATMEEDSEKAYYEANNVVSEIWKHKENVSTDVTMLGSKPNLTLDYTADPTPWMKGNQVTTTDKDVDVTVTVKVGSADVTEKTTFVRNKGALCTDTSKVEDCSAPKSPVGNTTDDPAFVVHIYDIAGDLVIEKKVVDEVNANTFTFTVTLSDTTIDKTFDGVTFTDGVATVTLHGGESVTITGLPANVGYTVTETALPGYTTTVAEGSEQPTSSLTKTGAIDGGGLDTVTFTNTYNPGTLTITKNVTKAEGVTLPKDTVFTFTVTLTDGTTPLTGTHNFAYTVTNTAGETVATSTATFTDGVAQIKLADGQRATFATLPVGVAFTVAETDIPTGYELDEDNTSGASGSITTTTPAAVFTNIHQYGNLVISKTVSGTPNGYTPDKFTFTVTLSDKTITGAYGDVTFANGIAEFTLEDGESKTIIGLPANTTYTIEEVAVPGYTTQYQASDDKGQDDTAAVGRSMTGTIDDAGIDTVAYTNEYKVGGLTVTKKVTGATAPNDGKGNFTDVFTFTLALTSNNAPVLAKGVICTIAGQETNVTWIDGKYTFELTHGQIATFVNLPDGVTYTVVEVVDDVSTHYTPTSTNTTGTITAGSTQEAKFTNDYKYGELTISKNVVNAPEGDTNRAFQFTVTLDQTAGVKYITSNDSTEKNFTGSIALKNGESVTFKYIPDDATYTVKETLVAGYATTVTGGDSIANDLTVSGAIVAGAKDEATFTNTYSVADLTITKEVILADSKYASPDDEFTIQVKLTKGANAVLAETYSITGLDADKYAYDSKKGIVTLTMKKDQIATIKGLQIDTGYEITETSKPGYYEVSYSSNKGTIATDGNQVTVTNAYQTGSLDVTKTVVGSTAPAGASFNFTLTVTYNNEPVVATILLDEERVTLSDSGTCTFTLENEETAKFTGLPLGASFTVEETLNTDYSTTMKLDATDVAIGDDGKLDVTGKISATTSAVAFTNTYQYSDLKISKTVVNTSTLYPTDDLTAVPFTFTVTLNSEGSYTYVVTDTATGEAIKDESDSAITGSIANNGTLTLASGQTATIKNIPVDTTYKVEETEVAGYTTTVAKDGTTVDSATGTIAVDTIDKIVFTNTYSVGQLVISKTVIDESGMGYDLSGDEFTFTVDFGNEWNPITYTKQSGSTSETCTFTNSITLKDGETATFDRIPAGVTYTVMETNLPTGYTQTTPANNANVRGQIEANVTSTAAFTNTYNTGSLTITKKGMRSGEVAVFNATVWVRGVEQNITVVVPDGQSTTINGLDLGSGYTVSEIGDWTWRYKATSSATSATIPATVTYTNTEENPYWLDGSAYADNAFGDTTPDNP